MKRTTTLTSIGIALVVTLVVAGVTTGALKPTHQWFKDSTRERLKALEATATEQTARIVILEQMVTDLDAGMTGLVADGGPLWTMDRGLKWVQDIVNAEHPPILLSAISPIVECDEVACNVSVEWYSDPPATGQVEWGETVEYGTLTTKEDGLLGYHRQSLGRLPLDTEFHYRILAGIPDEDVTVVVSGAAVAA